MKFFKLCSAFTALVFYAVAIGMFAVSFADYQGVISGKTQVATGFEIAFGQTTLETGNTLGTLFAFILVALGLACALFIICRTVLGGKSKRKANFNAKLLCGCCTFALLALLPALLLFFTLRTTGWAGNASIGGTTLAETKLGIGAILAAIFSLVGGTALGAALLK